MLNIDPAIFGEHFILDPGSRSWLTHRTDKRGGPRKGDHAGSLDRRGYWIVSLSQQRYKAHRIVFALHNGIDPGLAEVDHVDRVRTNNDPMNLRLLSGDANKGNRSYQSNNTTEAPGVYRHKASGKYQVCVSVAGSVKYFGLYDDLAEAVAVAEQARITHHKGYRPGSSLPDWFARVA
jgi:hypothetical protein